MSLFSFEQIYFQNNDPFKDNLITLVQKIYTDIETGRLKSNTDILINSTYGKDLVKLIKDRFNLSMVMDEKLSLLLPAAIIPFSSDYLLSAKGVNQFSSSFFSELFGSNNILGRLRSIEKERGYIYKGINNRKGFVDFKSARVGGYLADVKHILIINFFKLKMDGLSSEEVAAVITHEIGHAFDGLSAHYKMHTTNSAIMDTLNQLNENKTEKAFYTFKRHFDGKDLEEAKLNKDSQVTDFYGPLAARYMKELNSTLHNGKYDEANYEAMADSFAVRMGFGKDIVGGLNKLYLKQGISPSNSKQYFYMLLTIDIILLATCLVLSGVFGILVLALVFTLFSGTHNKDLTYDIPYDRFSRIRNGVISNLKDRTLPKEYVEELLTQLHYIDGVIGAAKGYKNYKGIFTYVADIVKPGAREAVAYIEIQQTIENSLNNNLFHKSAQLRVI